MQPFVSVIMPAYNAERYIGSAIESILNQTYKQFELLLIEDGSSDATLQVAERYTDPRIIRIKNDRNRGIAYTTNRGLKMSRGRYIALMDDDDIAARERLALQVEYLERHAEIDILGGRSAEIDGEGKLLDIGAAPRHNPNYIKAVLLFRCMDFRNGTTMIRKEFLDTHGLRYQEGCYGMQDFKFFIDSSKVGRISALDDLLLYYRQHEGNETKRQRHTEARKRKYAQLQRESLRASGYRLGEEEMLLIQKALAEYDGGCENREELAGLYEVFCKLIRQGKEMQIEYLAELEHYLKLQLSKQVQKLIHF